jgi:chromosome segregation protein
MISRVIEAKPEELRVFLEEAAGVSKYKERRKETEGRLADARDHLGRVEDIRTELGHQLEKLEAQAKVASEYRELESKHALAQQLLWFSKSQDAQRARERASAEIAHLGIALEALVADVRAAESKLETLRSEHYAAGDSLHERQGAFYAANAEVTRLEQQLAFARDSESRIAQQLAQITEQLAGLAGQQRALDADDAQAQRALEAALDVRARASAEEVDAQAALPALEESVRQAAATATEVQERIAKAEQAIRVVETRREHVERALSQLAQRRERLDEEAAKLLAPASDPVRDIEEQLAQEAAELAAKEASRDALRDRVQSLHERQRAASAQAQRTQKSLGDLDARRQALDALQAKIGQRHDNGAWLESKGLAHARRLFTGVDIDPGWDNALEAALRERLEAVELASLDAIAAWHESPAPPARLALFAPSEAAASEPGNGDALLARVRCDRPEISRLLADWLRGIRCRDGVGEAIRARGELGVGEAFVTRDGHLVSAQAVDFFAPDSELHGVLARKRELAELVHAIGDAREAADAAQRELRDVESDLDRVQQDYHAENLAFASQQRRCHDLELELLELRKAAEAASNRRAQIAAESSEVAAQASAEQAQATALLRELADGQSALHDEFAARDAARTARNEADVSLARGRERWRAAERALQEAAFAERSGRDRLAELARRREGLAAQVEQQQRLLAQLSSERAAIDWTPVEHQLQQQLAVRGEAEQALASARDRLEAIGAELRAAEEARLAAEHKLEPARTKIEDMRLKEQAAALNEQQFAEQLAQARADLAALPEQLKAFGNKSQLPGEIERLAKAIADLGAVNLAALDELAQASERKEYLDRQAADLVEAMSTLEHAIRQIDRESRQLLQQTFDTVNDNFAKLFPALFGGGQAKLVLTGEEILDSGVQVLAQPPGKRNTSIHLLSGGEKALTAISLVFALFQLNPAPFCLLDEVDAPLDDPNTERFCRMVRQMSEVTQFLFISHNKITMEMAGQLVGITMPEAGVSRVVAVDIAEAIELAQTQREAKAAA